eukprot:5835008-Pyramimonas_sp.AAC.1
MTAITSDVLTDEQVAFIRTSVIEKLDQQGGDSNNSNVVFQRVNAPERWLPRALYDSIATPCQIGGQRAKLFRVQKLAAFFGSGGLLHPVETTSRDITALALLGFPDGVIVAEGVADVDTFKTT